MFDFNQLQPEHINILDTLVPAPTLFRWGVRDPDVEIKPDGEDYIFRWHLIPRNQVGANVYLHLQVADDPERPLHDHPWDNQSVILAGGYREVFVEHPDHLWHEKERFVRQGQVVHRRAEEAHRIFLLPQVPYTISLFTTGPVIRDWGFWFTEHIRGATLIQRRWKQHDECIDASGRFIGEDHA